MLLLFMKVCLQCRSSFPRGCDDGAQQHTFHAIYCLCSSDKRKKLQPATACYRKIQKTWMQIVESTKSSWEITEGKKHKNCIKSMKLNRYCCEQCSAVEASASNLILITARNNQLSGEITAGISFQVEAVGKISLIISLQQDFAEGFRKCWQAVKSRIRGCSMANRQRMASLCN